MLFQNSSHAFVLFVWCGVTTITKNDNMKCGELRNSRAIFIAVHEWHVRDMHVSE